MLDRIMIVDAAIAGSGIYKWDNTYQAKWHNMDEQHKLDWLMLFDMFMDEPNENTQDIIDAIKSGLHPNIGHGFFHDFKRKDRVCQESKFWYFPCNSSNDFMFRFRNKIKPIHGISSSGYSYSPNAWSVIGISEDMTETMIRRKMWSFTFRYNPVRKVYLFHHLFNAWKFLLNLM